MRAASGLVAVALACGCGSSPASVSGIPFPARDAIFNAPDGGPATLWITSTASACTHAQQQQGVKNAQLLSIVLTPSAAVGTFPVAPPDGGPAASPLYFVADTSCANSPWSAGASGAVTVSSLTDQKMVGTFDITLAAAPVLGGTTAHLTGSFTASSCPGMGSYSPTACQSWATNCSSSNCTGCCDAFGACQAGTTNASCGSGAAFCRGCPSGSTGIGGCQNQVCPQCLPSNCNGCCDAVGNCRFPDNTYCGTTGNACVACSAGQVCNASGVCQ